MDIEQQKLQFQKVADAMEVLAEAIEPLFKAGSKVVAPGTDWWAIIAGDRHCNLYAAKMYRQMGEELDREREPFSHGERLDKLSKTRRIESLERAERESPCKGGCLLSWERQYKPQ